ncbi:hypothetical protein ACFQ2Y_02240 [Streptomyces malaysiensis subsp. malaysiensis]
MHTDGDADRGRGPVGGEQQGGGPLEATGEQVLVRRLAERGLKRRLKWAGDSAAAAAMSATVSACE